ncbi:MAG: putative NAD/FAD-binding protein [Nonlabens sp.]
MRIAVVGSGISGLAAAWMLAPTHEVHLFEKRDRLGGHTHTLSVGADRDARSSRHNLQADAATDEGRQPVDTGFIVYNTPTYPLLTQLLDELGVATQESDMSWSLRCEHHDLEYAGSGPGIMAQKKNLANPSYLRFIADILRFNRIANTILDDPRRTEITIGRFLEAGSFGKDFGRHYLVPMAAAIWSTGMVGIEQFPLATLLEFFRNHGLLGVTSHHPWRTVAGGTSSYITPLMARLDPANVHLGMGVQRIDRDEDGVDVIEVGGATHRFDKVLIAAHADQALAMLSDPSDDERELLGTWEYSANVAYAHHDAALLPKTPAARASWNYLLDDCTAPGPSVSLTYDMNRLQSIAGPTDWLVTLNPSVPPDPDATLWTGTYHHPSYTTASVATQDKLDGLNGQQHTFYAGAHHRYGFHEDGLWSAVRAVGHLGVSWPA